MQPVTLRRLGDLPDFEMTSDSPDVRGWAVRGAEGTSLGNVFELLVDPQALKVRYLVVELDARFQPRELEHYILLPAAAVSLDSESNSVFVPMLRENAVLSYPPYTEIQITPAFEEAMQRALGL